MEVVTGMLGGLAAALAGGLLVRRGVKPAVAAAGIVTVGGIGSLALPGTWRCAALGAGAFGVGQLALGWLEAERRAAEERRNAAQAFAAWVAGDLPGDEQVADVGVVEDEYVTEEAATIDDFIDQYAVEIPVLAPPEAPRNAPRGIAFLDRVKGISTVAIVGAMALIPLLVALVL
jgi:hypothetical protein